MDIQGYSTSNSYSTEDLNELYATSLLSTVSDEDSEEEEEVSQLGSIKEEFKEQLDELFENANGSLLSFSLNISDEVFEKMEEDAEYKEEVLQSIYDDIAEVQSSAYGVHLALSIGVDTYDKSATRVSIADSNAVKKAKNAAALENSEDSFYSNSNSNSKFEEKDMNLEAMIARDKEVSSMISSMKSENNFLTALNERKALLEAAESSNNFFSDFAVSQSSQTINYDA